MGSYVPSYSFKRPVFQPSMRVIAAITNSNPVVITTTVPHQYINNLIVRIDIPPGFGMENLNQQYTPITVLTTTTFSMPIDTTTFNPFVLPASFPPTYQDAQSVPIAETNDMLTGAVQNVLPYSAT